MKKKKSGIKVRILNRLPGEAQFTSEENAKKFVEQKLAVMKEGGLPGETGLFFIHSLRNFRRETKAARDYWASQRKCINWSASSPSNGDLFRPGEVRS